MPQNKKNNDSLKEKKGPQKRYSITIAQTKDRNGKKKKGRAETNNDGKKEKAKKQILSSQNQPETGH